MRKNKKIGFIPLRSGSKSIPNKNKKILAGRPLYQWVLTEAIFSNLDEVYVFTNDSEIMHNVEKDYAWTPKVKAIKRSDENASDYSSTEDAIFEFCNIISWEFEYIVLLQATSPLTSFSDINNSLDIIQSKEYHSLLSCVKTKRFIWSYEGKSLNYNYVNRPRRQDFDGYLVENGAIYITHKGVLKKYKNRLGGNIGIYEMNQNSLYEIDEPIDLLILEQLLIKNLEEFKTPYCKTELVVLDLDGVFTDGKVSYSRDGEFSKFFSLKDGMGIEVAKRENIEIIVITSENSSIVAARMQKLNIEVHLGVKDKFSYLTMLLNNKNLNRNQVAYLGDDINDLTNIVSVGLSFCPNDANHRIKTLADFVLKNSGGNNVVREMIELIIKLNKRF